MSYTLEQINKSMKTLLNREKAEFYQMLFDKVVDLDEAREMIMELMRDFHEYVLQETGEPCDCPACE